MVNNPVLDIIINSKSLESADIKRITELVVHHEINTPGLFSIEFLSETLEGKSWDNLTFEKFNLGDEVQILMENKKLIQGEIYSIEPKFEKSTGKVIIRGYDFMNRLKIGKKNNVYSDKKDSQILEDILGKYQIGTQVESSNSVIQNLIQFSMSDFKFVEERCAFNGYIFYMNEKELIAQKPDLSSAAEVTLSFPQDVIDGEIYMTLESDSGTPVFRGWDESKKEFFEINKSLTATEGQMGDEKTIMQRYEEGFSETKTYLTHPEIADAESAEGFVDGQFLLNSLQTVKGQLTLQGNININLAKNIEISGVGKFCGKYFVKEVKHSYRDNLLETELSVLRVGV